MHAEYANDFGVFRLHPTLVDLGCDAPTTSKLIDWFWQNANRWARECASQLEFDATARTCLAAEAARPTGRDLDTLLKAASIGVNARVPDRMRIRQRDVAEDSRQDAAVKLLEDGVTDERSANVAGQTAARRNARQRLREVPVSQLDLPEADPDDTAAPDERDKIAPWDRVDTSDYYRDNLSEDITRLLQHLRLGNQEAVIKAWADECPEDFEFIVNYFAQTRRGRFSKKDQNRAQAIYRKLRRRLADA